jgi:hypothetical protein
MGDTAEKTGLSVALAIQTRMFKLDTGMKFKYISFISR